MAVVLCAAAYVGVKSGIKACLSRFHFYKVKQKNYYKDGHVQIGEFAVATSLRHYTVEFIWTSLRGLRLCVYPCWDFWPHYSIPENRPAIGGDLMRAIYILLPTFPCAHLRTAGPNPCLAVV